MNEEPNTPPPVAPHPWTPPAAPSARARAWKDPFVLEPMTDEPTSLNAIASLLKTPGRVLFQLNEAGGRRLTVGLFVCSILCLLAFGFLLGTFSGGTQLWAAPTKVVLGTLASILICLPSFVIFSLLSGTDCPVGRLCTLLLMMLALIGLLLAGFAPVVWVFAQSSSEVGFMGGLGLLFWCLACLFGLRLLIKLAGNLGSRSRGALLAWGGIFLLVTFQMTSTLRPILGPSDTFFPKTKMGFLENWLGSGVGDRAVRLESPERD